MRCINRGFLALPSQFQFSSRRSYNKKMPRELCLLCSRVVTDRQQALQCDGCVKWCHRVCGTGISRAEYNQLMKRTSFEWRCRDCTLDSGFLPTAESTRLSSHALLSMAEVAIQPTSFVVDEQHGDSLGSPKNFLKVQQSSMGSLKKNLKVQQSSMGSLKKNLLKM